MTVFITTHGRLSGETGNSFRRKSAPEWPVLPVDRVQAAVVKADGATGEGNVAGV